MSLQSKIAHQLEIIQSEITKLCALQNLLPQDVLILAVSKGQSVEHIRAAYALGLRDFGESYIQEWLKKRELLADLKDIRWHFIGHIQSNKIKFLIEHFYMLHSIDRLEILKKILELKKHLNLKNIPHLLIQMQVDAKDTNKFGANPTAALAMAQFMKLEQLPWVGFMGIGPADTSTGDLKILFSEFIKSASNIWTTSDNPQKNPIFSLGMSYDYPTAIQCGSNLIRLGSHLFGKRAQLKVTN